MTMEFRVACTVIVVKRGMNENHYLLLKRKADTLFPNEWCVPGGKVDEQDFQRSPDTPEGHHYYILEWAASREVYEEVHQYIAPERLHYLLSLSYPKENQKKGLVASFWGEPDDSREVRLEEGYKEYCWLTIDEVRQLPNVVLGLKEEIEMVDRLLPPKQLVWKLKYPGR